MSAPSTSASSTSASSTSTPSTPAFSGSLAQFVMQLEFVNNAVSQILEQMKQLPQSDRPSDFDVQIAQLEEKIRINHLTVSLMRRACQSKSN
jgi:hypothetical protein